MFVCVCMCVCMNARMQKKKKEEKSLTYIQNNIDTHTHAYLCTFLAIDYRHLKNYRNIIVCIQNKNCSVYMAFAVNVWHVKQDIMALNEK